MFKTLRRLFINKIFLCLPTVFESMYNNAGSAEIISEHSHKHCFQIYFGLSSNKCETKNHYYLTLYKTIYTCSEANSENLAQKRYPIYVILLLYIMETSFALIT